MTNCSNGFIIVLVGNTTGVVSLIGYWQFPYSIEWSSGLWAALGVNDTNPIAVGSEEGFIDAGIYAYTIGNVTIASDVADSGFGLPKFPYNLPNGTYLAWLLSFNHTGVIYLCILEFINTWNWNTLANYTFLSAQY